MPYQLWPVALLDDLATFLNIDDHGDFSFWVDSRDLVVLHLLHDPEDGGTPDGEDDRAQGEAVLAEPDRYVRVSYEPRSGRLFDFMRTLRDPGLLEAVREAERGGRGAFRRVRQVLEEHGAIQLWYDFERTADREMAADWLAEQGVVPPAPGPEDLARYQLVVKADLPVAPVDPEDRCFQCFYVDLTYRDAGSREDVEVLPATVWRGRRVEGDLPQDTGHTFLDHVCAMGLVAPGRPTPAVLALVDGEPHHVLVLELDDHDRLHDAHYALIGEALLDAFAGPGTLCFLQPQEDAPEVWVEGLGAVHGEGFDLVTR